ncbi:MAG: hypothetical protein ACNS61_05535 [Candidatus Wenzhouxiangella sp. M2_3B_020]
MITRRLFGGLSGMMVALVLITTFSFGTLAGASVAENESRTFDSAAAEFSAAEDGVVADLKADIEPPADALLLPLYIPLTRLSFDVAAVGLAFGHANPALAHPVAQLGMAATIAIPVGMIALQLRRLWRMR